MATLVDIDNVRAGYFWTSSFEEVVAYVLRYLEIYNHSINFVVHNSAIFFKDGEEEQEIHMSPSHPILIDPDTPDIVNALELLYDDMNDPENWQGLNGSGYRIVSNTMNYWFKIIPYAPNNRPRDTNRNTRDPPDFDDDDESIIADDSVIISATPSPKKYDTLWIAIGYYHVPNPNRLSQARFYGKIVNWLESQGIRPDTYDADRITPANIANWHEQIQRFNIRVFSQFGNVLYSRTMENHSEFIDVLWKYNKFKLITNLWALLAEKHSRIFCNQCKKFHRSEESCKEFIVPAQQNHPEVPEYPEGRHAFVMYADFESIVTPTNDHQCSGYAFIGIDENKEILASYDANAIDIPEITKDFVEKIFEVATDYAFTSIILNAGGIDPATLILHGVRAAYRLATSERVQELFKRHFCPICDDEILGDVYVEAKNFINGRSGRHHKECWEDPKNCMVCYFHNFRGYDSHYILRELMRNSDYKCDFIRGKTFEKFDIMSAITTYRGNVVRITFKDTFNYLSTSIARLVAQVESWKYTPLKDRDAKGTFPYKWFDNISKLNNTELPPDDQWFNDITQTTVDSAPAHQIWRREGFRKFSQFHDYYMKTDVLQLADIFEEFRDSCLSAFDLDPIYFQGAPGYTWQLNLKINYDKMFLIRDKNIYQDIQKNIRGGISQVMHRYINIEDKPNECILYLDVNSLYSKCMTYPLPTKFIMEIRELPQNWMDMYTGNSLHTALLCVDLHYPEYLHDLHIAYPLAPHKYDGRLCTTFLEKEYYLCHAELLKFYIENGLIIIKFHYGYVFEQSPILANYVESNIYKRRNTTSAPLQTLYKLLNNSLYGKTCENKFKYRKFQIHEEEAGVHGRINSFLNNATNWLPIEDQVLVEHKINKVILDKPIQLGFAILEFAKLEIYKFLFLIQDEFSSDVTPLYTDTDSIMLHFKVPNPQEILYANPQIRELLDFDKVPDHWQIRTPGTNKKSGLWSLETLDRIVEFVGIRAKTYCYRTDRQTILKNKGVTANAIELISRDKLTIEHYKQVLFSNKDFKVVQYTIGSKKHQIKTKETIKIALTNNDEKRQVLPDKITTLPFGYKGEKFADYIIHDPDNLLG